MKDGCHSTFQARREGEREFYVTPREGHWKGVLTKWFSIDEKKPEVMGQNGHDFRNQSDKLPQKHVFIFQIQFDPLKVVVSVISTHIIQGKVKI